MLMLQEQRRKQPMLFAIDIDGTIATNGNALARFLAQQAGKYSSLTLGLTQTFVHFLLQALHRCLVRPE
jgi:hypothetical protein